jgi:hypothetical protein
MRLEDGQCSHPPDHKVGISLGEAVHAAQDSLWSSSACVRPATGRTGILEVPRIYKSSQTV